MKILKKKWFWILVVIALIVVLAVVNGSQKNKTTYETAKVTRGNLIQTVDVTGSVKSAEEVQLNFTLAGKINDISVKSGDQVTSGKLLASLVAGDLSSQVKDAQAALDIARSDYDQLLAGASSQDVEVTKQEVTSAEVAYQKALNDLAALENTRDLELANLISQNINTNNNKLAVAQFALDTVYDAVVDSDAKQYLVVSDLNLLSATRDAYLAAKNNLDQSITQINSARSSARYEDVVNAAQFFRANLEQILAVSNDSYSVMTSAVGNSIYTSTVISNFKTSLSTQSSAVSTAISSVQTDLSSLTSAKLSYENQITSAHDDVDAKLSALNLAKARLELKTSNPRDFEIKAAEARIKRAQATLDRYYSELGKTVIRAPFDGIVTAVNYKKGEQTNQSEAVINMIGLSEKEIEVDVPESDITKITLADPVEITLDAFSSDQKFAGQVAFIDPAATVINSVVYYKVKVLFNEDNPIIKSGMTADLVIRTDSRENVLLVPSRSVIYREDKKFAQLLENNQLVEKPVETGLRGDDGMVEVLSGLSEGETVITYINDGKKK